MSELGLTEDDFCDYIHASQSVCDGLSFGDARLSMNVPIVINYELLDFDTTDYCFKQKFEQKDIESYFERMKFFSSKKMNDIIDESGHELHFFRTKIQGKLYKLLSKLSGDKKPDDSTIIYHFALYTDKNRASREENRRSPRIYFMLGKNGVIFPLFFDPYHEINP